MQIQARAYEKRQATRYALNMSAVAEVGWREGLHTQLKNVSISGAYFTSDVPVKKGEIMSVKCIAGFPCLISGIVLPRLQGTVVRTDAGGFAVLLKSGRIMHFAMLGQFCSVLLNRPLSCAAPWGGE